MRFGLNSNSNYSTENEVPYALAGDREGDYHRWNIRPGTYTIRATPYSADNAGGIAGSAVTLTITIKRSVAPTTGITLSGKRSAGQGKVLQQGRLTAYPNPVVSEGFVEFWLPQTTVASVVVVDAAGRIVQQVFNGMTEAGVLYKRPLRSQGLARGVYIVRLVTGEGKMMTQQLILQ